MAYVADFEWDIFISYPMEAEAWTRRFAADLLDGTELPAAIAPRIYFAGRDWRLGGTSDDMLEAARKSALFVAVLTRDSLSEHHKRFLTQEMDNFQKSGPIKDRFCPIPLHPISSSQLKEAMATTNPEAFWNTNLTFFYDDGDGIPLRLKPDSEPRPGEYSKRVQKVAYQLRELLEKLRSSRSDEVRINSHGPFAGTTVFLARKGTETYIESEWLTVRNTLLSDGSTVVPTFERNDDRRYTDVELLERADLFVQLFHGLDRLEDAKAQLKGAEAEAELRKSKTGKLLPILRWRKKHFNATADANLVGNLLEEDQKFCQGAQTGTLEEFKLAISDKLQECRNPPHPPPPPDSQPYLYITADKSDRDLAIKIQARAREQTLADVMTRDETRQRDDFIEGLTRASGIIFLYGNAEASFIEAWSKEFIRNAGLSKLLPKFKNRKWLYLAPPEKGQSGELMLPFDLRVEGSQTEFTLEGIEKICAELRGVCR
jgi:hypothetical protein